MFVRLSLLLLTVCRIVFGVCRIFFHQCLSDCTVCRIFLHENPANWPKLHMTQFKIMVQYQGSEREKILEGTKLGQMECAGALRPRDGLPEHFGI